MMQLFFTIMGVLIGCILYEGLEGLFNKAKLVLTYKVDMSLKYAHETNDEFVERAFKVGLGSYRIKGWWG